MPFDGIADPVAAKSLQALDLMEDRLQGGRKWTRHFMFRDGGKMCLLGASYFGATSVPGARVTGRWNTSRGRSRRGRAPRTGATAAGSRRPSRTSTITARAMAKSSAFCAPRKSWPVPTLRRHSQHKDRAGFGGGSHCAVVGCCPLVGPAGPVYGDHNCRTDHRRGLRAGTKMLATQGLWPILPDNATAGDIHRTADGLSERLGINMAEVAPSGRS